MENNRSYSAVLADSIDDWMVTNVLALELQDQVEADVDTVAIEKTVKFSIQ